MDTGTGVREKRTRTMRIEWLTIWLVVACYAIWAGVTYYHTALPLFVWLPIAVICTALHSSLMHEVCHGHPTNRAWLNEGFVILPISLFVPYRRFKDLHLKHHKNEWLTDPYDDPESFYLAQENWTQLPPWKRRILTFNNTMLGRLTIGPGINIVRFFASDIRLMLDGDRQVLKAWIIHGIAALAVFYWVRAVCGLSLVFYATAIAYPAYALIMIRTFAEHQADNDKNRRSVLVERPRIFSWLFLNNNLHYLHHKYPSAPWYKLPSLFREMRNTLVAENGGYVFRSYKDQFARYGVTPKEPVAHPLWNLRNRSRRRRHSCQ